MKKDNEYKGWQIVRFPIKKRLWFAAWCKRQGKTIAEGLEEVIDKLKKEVER